VSSCSCLLCQARVEEELMQMARIASSLEARLREAEAATSAVELRAVDADRAAREVIP